MPGPKLLLLGGLLLFSAAIITHVNCADENSPSRPVNIFVINDEKNEVANKSINFALKTTKEKSPNKLGEIYITTIDGSDSNEAYNRICGAWKSAIQGDASKIPDFVLDTTTYGPGAETVNRITAAVAVPTLTAQFGQEGDLLGWREIKDNQNMYLVQVMNPADLLPEVIRQQCDFFNITNAAILFDDDFVVEHKYKSLLLNIPTRHVMTPAQPAGEPIRKQIKNLRDLDIVNFFIMGTDETISAALEAGIALNFTGREYGWFAITLNENFNLHCDCDNISVMLFKPKVSESQKLSELTKQGLLPQPWISSAFYYDLTTIGIDAMKAAIDAGEWPRPSYIDCESYEEKTGPDKRSFDFKRKLEQVTSGKTGSGFKPTYGGFVWGKNGESRSDFETSVTIAEIRGGKIASEEPVASWTAGIETPFQFTNQQRSMNHTAVTTLRVVTVIKYPFVQYDNKTQKYVGYAVDLLEAIRGEMGFEYKIRVVDDNEYGYMDENGNWNGIVRELVEKRADLGIGGIAVMAERENVIDYTVPFYDLVGISILMKKPKGSTSLFKFLTVLEGEVWGAIFLAYLFTSFLMYIFDRFSPYSYQNNREKYKYSDEKREFTAKECLWFCMTSLTPQGGGEAPRCLSGRLVAATWWLFGFIIIASYTANLAAFLTVSRLDTPIDSLEDLSKQYKVQYAPVKNSSEHRFFTRMADIERRFYEIWKDMSLNDSLSNVERAKLAVWEYPVSDKYTKMLQMMSEVEFPASFEEGVKRVAGGLGKEEFALIAEAADVKYIALTNCSFLQVGEEFSRKPYAMAVQQGSPLKDQINNALLSLLNERRLERLKERWWNRNPLRRRCRRWEDHGDGISIYNIGGVFVVIVLGIIFAFVTLIFEYWYYKLRPRVVAINDRTRAKFNKSTKLSSNTKPIKINLKPAKFTNTFGMSDKTDFESKY